MKVLFLNCQKYLKGIHVSIYVLRREYLREQDHCFEGVKCKCIFVLFLKINLLTIVEVIFMNAHMTK